MNRNWKKVALKLLTATAMGFAFGALGGLMVGSTYYVAKKYQMDNHHPTNMTLPEAGQELINSFANVMLLFILPAVCVVYGAAGGALTALLTALINRGKLVGALIGAGIGTLLFFAEWTRPSELLPYAIAAIPLEAFIGWLIAWFFTRPAFRNFST